MYISRILLDKAPAGDGTGGISTADINLSDPAFAKLGLPQELRETPLANGPGVKPKEDGGSKIEDGKKAAAAPAGETTEAKAEREAEEALAQRAKDAGKSVEDLRAEEAAAATAETERLTAKAAELGKTVEEVQALEAEEAAASAPPEMDDAQTEYVQSLVTQHETEKAELAAKAEAATAEAAQLKTQLESAKRPPLQVMGIHPIFLASSEQEIAAQEATFANFEKWALANWDGSAAVEPKGDQPGVPAYTAEQVRNRYSEIKEARAQLVPKAKAVLAQRLEGQKAVATIYPALFDSKRPESNVVRNYLDAYPELQVIFPNFHQVAGDSLLGERLRVAAADPKHAAHAAAKSLVAAVPELKALLNLTTGQAVPSPNTNGKKFVLPPKPGAKGAAVGKAPRPGGSGLPSRGAAGAGKNAGPSAKALNDLKAGGLNERDALKTMIGGMDLPTLAHKE